MKVERIAVLVLLLVLGIALGASAQKAVKVTGNLTDIGADWGVSMTTSCDGQIVYVLHAGGLFKSTDGGEQWVRLDKKPE